MAYTIAELRHKHASACLAVSKHRYLLSDVQKALLQARAPSTWSLYLQEGQRLREAQRAAWQTLVTARDWPAGSSLCNDM